MEKQWCVVLINKEGLMDFGSISAAGANHHQAGSGAIRFAEEKTTDVIVDIFMKLDSYRCVQKVELDVDESDFGKDD